MIGVAVGLCAAALAGGAYWLSRGPRRLTAGDLRVHRLADGVFIYRGFFSNSAVLAHGGDALLVDTQVAPRAARRLVGALAAYVNAPVRRVVNTHYHGDHSGGNAEFTGTAEIIATEETARFIVERDGERVAYAKTFGLEFQAIHETVGPTRTFRGAIELPLGDSTVSARQIGGGETTDACIVHWPDRGVVACGDAVTTWDYPFLGVPFLDEGLRDDGEWIGVIGSLRALAPQVLIPGHGPALTGAKAIAARLDLLAQLYADLLGTVKEELARGLSIPEVVDRVAQRLAHYPARPELYEHTVSQRFAIYRAVNSLVPERAGNGWWHDLRPSVLRLANPDRVREAMDLLGATPTSDQVCALAERAARGGDRPLAGSVLETWIEGHPRDAAAGGLLSDVLFDGARRVRPAVDGMEYIAAASARARWALAIAPSDPLALLNLGAAEVFGGMVLAQDMDPGMNKLNRALESGALNHAQTRKAHFFLGKAHQMELREGDCDYHLRRALPGWASLLYPLLRARIRAIP